MLHNLTWLYFSSTHHPNHIMPFSISDTNHVGHSNSQVPNSTNSLFFPFYHFQFLSNFSQSMDPINASQIHQSLDLLELCWFFDNLLIRRRNPMLSTCLSNVAHQVFVESPVADVCSSGLDMDVCGGERRNLLRTPSLPSHVDRGEGIREEGNGSRPLLEHGVVVECSADSGCSSALDMDVLIGNGGGSKHVNFLRTPSLPSRVDRGEGIREEGNVSRPLLEHGVVARCSADSVCSSALDMDILIGNGGGKHMDLLGTPSLPSRVDREEGIREKGSDARPLSENGVLVECHADDACSSALDMDVFPENGSSKRRSLLRAPSMPSRVERREGIREKGNGSRPPYVERKEEGTHSKESGSTRRSNSARKPRHGNRIRTPSLPPCIGREREFGEQEAAARIRNSIQSNHAEFFPTRQEILEKNFSLPMRRIPTNNDETWNQFLIQMRRRRRSQSELESEELQGFKDLGFTFDKKDINPTMVDIIPGLREKKEEDMESERAIKGPYLSEAWMLQNHIFPPIPKWDTGKSQQDMKLQIKFWARAVASNVH